MSIYGAGIADNSQAFDEIGAVLFLISERLDKELELIQERSTVEQAALALVHSLGLLCGEYRKSANLMILKSQVDNWERLFSEWYEARKNEIPEEYRLSIKSHADTEFGFLRENITG